MASPIRYTDEQLEEHLKWKLEHKEFIIKYLDSKIPSPKQRGEEFYNLIKNNAGEATNWDVICACTEMLAFLTPEFPQFSDAVKELAKQVYSAHYLYLNDNVADINELQSEFAKSS